MISIKNKETKSFFVKNVPIDHYRTFFGKNFQFLTKNLFCLILILLETFFCISSLLWPLNIKVLRYYFVKWRENEYTVFTRKQHHGVNNEYSFLTPWCCLTSRIFITMVLTVNTMVVIAKKILFLHFCFRS